MSWKAGDQFAMHACERGALAARHTQDQCRECAQVVALPHALNRLAGAAECGAICSDEAHHVAMHVEDAGDGGAVCAFTLQGAHTADALAANIHIGATQQFCGKRSGCRHLRGGAARFATRAGCRGTVAGAENQGEHNQRRESVNSLHRRPFWIGRDRSSPRALRHRRGTR